MVPSGPGDQVELVLNDQIRREQGALQRTAFAGLGGPIESVCIVAVGAAEQGPGLADPGQAGELVDGGDDEAGQAAIQRLVDRDEREG
jgi:hypothetical protein